MRHRWFFLDHHRWRNRFFLRLLCCPDLRGIRSLATAARPRDSGSSLPIEIGDQRLTLNRRKRKPRQQQKNKKLFFQAVIPLQPPVPEAAFPSLALGLGASGLSAAAAFFV